MTEDDRTRAGDDAGAVSASEQQTTEQPAVGAEHESAEARGAELQEELAVTDARRAEEETAKKHEAAEQARRDEEKAAEREREAKQRAERLHEESEAARTQAERARETAAESGASTSTSGVGGASISSPGIGSTTDPAAAAAAARDAGARSDGEAGGLDSMLEGQRPEILAGAAFAGAFVLARILKRILD